MSLNDYFAANGSVYLRPMAINDCFNMPGLPPPHALKPPSLQPPQQQKPPRSMAAVSPLHLPPYEGGGFGGPQPPNSRTSSFAAALRKLAKQAVDPVSGEKDPSSPVSSPLPHTPKRTPSFLATHQGAATSYGGGSSSPPPVVTIAPSRPVATHTADSRKVVDLSSAPPNPTNTPLSNGHLPDTMKMDSSKRHDKWEESTLSKSGSSSSTSQVRPHATIAPLPRPDDSVTSSRGFQPYRGGGGGGSDDPPRNTLPHHSLSLFEHPAAYPYAPAAAFLPPPHMPHPAYRFDDPLYLERYGLLRPPMLPYAQPLMGPPFYPSSRYDLIAHSLSLSNSSMLSHERFKAEEQDRRLREKELELKEQERQRERENREKEHRERRKDEQSEHRKSSSSSSSSYSSSKRTESPSVRNTSSILNNMPVTAVSSNSSSIPLNLVLQSSAELPRKESTELWMPWQQPTAAKDANHEAKHPAFRTQDNPRHHQTNDKPPQHLRFSPPTLNDKKQPTNDTTTNDRKQHLDLNNRTTAETNSRATVYQDYHQRTLPEQQHRPGNSHETSHKDSSGPHEWRHEKLQKACTNIHRKTHESKKKDGCGLYPLGHRKNGAIFAQGTKPAAPPLLYQNEGMHARLLENEKCRLEMNGHVQKTTVVAPPAPYKTVSSGGHYAAQQQQSKDPCHKSFSDYFATSTLPKCSSDVVPPVVSKLDLDLKRLRKGQRPTHEEEEKEEKRIKSLLLVARVPRIKFDPNPNKLNFLRMFGLTTHIKKKKVEFDMFLKRRERLRLDSSLSSSPLVTDEATRLKNELDDFDELVPVNSLKIERLSERLRIEDCGSEKENFMAVVGLKSFTTEQKEEKERQRRKVYDEKCRRHFRILATVNRKSSPKRLFVPKSEAAQRLDHLRKLSEMNSLPSGLVSMVTDQEEETKHNSATKMEQVPYPSPVSKCNKFSFKRGHSLKREFRFAAPHSAKSKCDVVLKKEVAPGCASATRGVSTQVDAAELGASELKSSLSSSATIEVIMGVILRNQTEQSTEKSVLSDRCQQLRQTHDDLKKQAEALTRHMSDLLRSKRELDEERQRSQQSIDHLKKCLQVGR